MVAAFRCARGQSPARCQRGDRQGRASARLAELIDADMLIILTAVEKVAINFGKPEVQWLDT